MYLNKNLPELLIHHDIAYPSQPLPTSPSHTASALQSAHQGWHSLLIDVNFRLNSHLSDMQTVGRTMLAVDEKLSSSLEKLP